MVQGRSTFGLVAVFRTETNVSVRWRRMPATPPPPIRQASCQGVHPRAALTKMQHLGGLRWSIPPPPHPTQVPFALLLPLTLAPVIRRDLPARERRPGPRLAEGGQVASGEHVERVLGVRQVLVQLWVWRPGLGGPSCRRWRGTGSILATTWRCISRSGPNLLGGQSTPK